MQILSFKKILKKYTENDVRFTKHAKIKLKQMPFDEEFVVKKLFELDKLVYEEFQKDKGTYKLVYEHSARYLIVIVVSVVPKSINVVTVYKTSKKLQKLMKKAGIVHISKRFLIYKT